MGSFDQNRDLVRPGEIGRGVFAMTERMNSERRRVVAWTSFESVETRGLKDIGGWGGFIDKGHRWADFIAAVDPALVAHFEALREAILARGLARGGDWHQSA